MMTSTKELKNVTKSLKTVKNTLFEMLGPQSDGFEESKLNLLLGMDSCGNLNSERDRLKKNQSIVEIPAEDSSTVDCNLSAKEISRKYEETKKSQNLVSVEDSSVTEIKQKISNDDYSFDSKVIINSNNTLNKSAFKTIQEKSSAQMYSVPTNSILTTQNEGGLNNCYSPKFGNSFSQVENFNRHKRKPTSHDANSNVYSFNLTTNNYNHTNSNNYQNNNFHNNSSSNKQILFTSIKNNYRREKKATNHVNFQIIKTNQNLESSLPNTNKNQGSNTTDKVLLQNNCENRSINQNTNTAISLNNSLTLGSLSTKFNSNVTMNISGLSAFKRNIHPNIAGSSSRENLIQVETKNSKVEESKSSSSFTNAHKSIGNCTTTSQILNLPPNSYKENSYLKFLIIAAESIIEKGLNFLEEIQIEEKESSSTGLNCEINHRNKQDLDNSIDNSKLKYESSECNDNLSNNTVINFCKNSSLNNFDTSTESLRKCDNKVCGVIASKKLGWCKVKINKSKNSWLCRACFKAWKNNQFCYYCNVIYRDNNNASNYNDNKSWVQCDFCEMWHHIQCEEAKGYYSDLNELLSDSDFKYMCPLCRCKSESINYDSTNKIGEKTKIRTKNKKSINGYGNNHDFIGYKTRHDKDLDYNQVVNNSKRSKKKCVNGQINETINGSKDPINTTNCNAFSTYSLFNSYDNRDIYHDLYRISTINDERKK